jgi:hypothetical protein
MQRVADDRGPTFGDTVRAALDGTLVPLGFLSGQGGNGVHDGGDQVIYCTGYSEFVARFPDVRPPYEYDDDMADHACLDLVLEGSSAGVKRVSFEGAALDALLSAAGELELAAASSQWPGVSVASDLDRVRRAMSALLRRGS